MPRKRIVLSEKLTEKQERMLHEDTVLDVTEQEVAALLGRMTRLRYPEEEVLCIRRKYDSYINDGLKQLRLRCGLSVDEEFRISKDPVHRIYLIDGYKEPMWMMLNRDDFVPGIEQLRIALDYCDEHRLQAEREVILSKYGHILKERDRRILRKNGLPEDTPYIVLDTETIDGLTFVEWKLLNQPDFMPSKQRIRMAIKQFEKYGEDDKAAQVYNKYSKILDDEDSEPELSYEEALKIFERFGIRKIK